MTTITLTRNKPDRFNCKAVTGQMTFPIFERDGSLGQRTAPTLENADYIIPAGTYPVERTFSPKFRKTLPEILNVPDRSGIRIHRGTLPEHSQGCVLLDMRGMTELDVMFNQLDNFFEDEKVQIKITDPDDSAA